MVKLAQMQQFQAVCRYGGVTRAAAALHISQPSISASIRELETEFGVNLFHRINRRMTLTREGEYFLQKVDALLEQVELLQQEMRDFGGKKNHIKIGVPPMIGTFLFPPMFDAFRERYPEIRMEIMEHGSLQTRELVGSEVLDLAIAILAGDMVEHFQVLPIHRTRLVYCVRPDHRLAGRQAVDLASLAEEPMILFKTDSYQNAVMQERYAQLGLTPNVLLYSNQLYTINRFIAQGQAGAFLFQEIADMEPDLVGIPLADPIEMDIGLIWKKDRHLYSDVSRFVEFTRQFRYAG